MSEGAPLFAIEGSAPPSSGRAFFFETADGRRLRGAVWAGRGRGLAVLLQGRTEFIEKYYGVIARLQDLGFDVAALDWRGQGLSPRALQDPRKGHVESFEEYQRDLDAFLTALIADGAAAPEESPWLMIGHSMGGAIGARALMRRAKNAQSGKTAPPPGRFKAAVFSAPMLRLKGGPMRRAAMRFAARISVAAGRSRAYVPGAGPQTTAHLGFEDNVLTSDERQFELYARFIAAYPELALGGATWGWLHAALAETRRLRPTETPAMAVVGEADAVVDNAAALRYAESTPRGRVVSLPEARHEPFIERPAQVERLWRGVSAFLDEIGM